MVQQLDRLRIAESMPEDIDNSMVVNRVLDVRSACMVYLALNIRHEATPLGTVCNMYQEFDLIHLGKVVKTFVLGDQKISDSTDYLKSWVDKLYDRLKRRSCPCRCELDVPVGERDKRNGER